MLWLAPQYLGSFLRRLFSFEVSPIYRTYPAYAKGMQGVRDLKVMWIGLLGGADALVRGRPPGRPFLW
jgi:hypothetical protein